MVMDYRGVARALGSRGGRARAKRLSVERRRVIASLGGVARRESLAAARRIADNFAYAAAAEALHGDPGSIERLSEFDGPVPGLRRLQPQS
jgi:hypothetical protein